jgi:hypothetical protein
MDLFQTLDGDPDPSTPRRSRIPDKLSILAFSTRLRGKPAPHDLFGLLRIENNALVN